MNLHDGCQVPRFGDVSTKARMSARATCEPAAAGAGAPAPLGLPDPLSMGANASLEGAGGEAMQAAILVASGRFTPDVLAWLQRRFSTWINAQGEVSLERCLRLPGTATKMRQALRDVWLSRAAEGFADQPSTWLRSVALSDALTTFITRGQWVRWRDLADAPAGCCPLDEALFYLAKTNEGDGLSPRQVHRILFD